jgi:DNA-binding CsgD family transcriptional regulator
VVEDAKDRRTRSKLLAAFVEIMLAAHDVPAARAAANELSEIAAVFDSLFLRAASAHASGAVLLAEGDARGASASLHDGWTAWRQLEAPFEEARTRVLMAQACRELGDADTAALELEAARQVFKQLGAAPDLARTQEFSLRSAPKAAGGLSAREVQVIRLLATGKTNRAIADELFISEKTVGRHVSNIFTKLGLSSRAAATAYAYKHDLV